MDGFFDPAENPAPARPLFGLDTQAKQPLGRPGNFLVKTEKTLAKKQVEGFFRDVLPGSLRVKGVFLAEDGVWYYADGVNDQIDIKPLGYTAKETIIVVIPHPSHEMRGTVRKSWLKHCGEGFTLS